MKKIFLATLGIAALLGACADQEQVDTLQKDVDALKLEVFGNPLAKCDEADYIDLDAYASSTVGLPSADAEDWHALNGEREGVQTSPSGLQYTIVKEGNADAPTPELGETVKVNYHGFFKNGESFDSSYQRGQPAQFPSNRVIKGWVEALTGMKPCEARTLYIPADLAYGDQGRPGIEPNSTLIFNVQLLSIGDK